MTPHVGRDPEIGPGLEPGAPRGGLSPGMTPEPAANTMAEPFRGA